MNKIKLAAALASIILCASCSRSESDKPTAAPSQKPAEAQSAIVATPVTPPTSSAKVAISSNVPEEMNGFVFELGGKCGIDSINTAQRVEVASAMRADGLNVDGWAMDEQAGSVPPVLALQLVDGEKRYYAILTRHAGREDLVKEFGKPEFGSAGYSASIDIAQLPGVQYDMLLIQKSGTRNIVCPTYRKLVVKD